MSNTLITVNRSNGTYNFEKTIKKCDIRNTPLCDKLLKNEIIDVSLPQICINSCGNKLLIVYVIKHCTT